MKNSYSIFVLIKAAFSKIEITCRDGFVNLVSFYPGQRHDGKSTRSRGLTVGTTQSAHSRGATRYLLLRFDERSSAVEHHKPSLADKLVRGSAERVSADAVLADQLRERR